MAEEEGILNYVRNIINQNKVRLWESPFYDGSKPDEDEMMKLSLNLEPSSEIPQEQILFSLYHLQRNALDKLESRKALKDSGMTKLKIKYPKSLASTSIANAIPPSTVEIDASLTSGIDLRHKIASLMSVPDESIKLISSGKVLREDKLGHLTPGSSVMVVPITKTSEEFNAGIDQNKALQSSKNDAELLKDDDRIVIGDQSGKSLNLPKRERRALIMAMSLHERAKGNLKKKNFSLALVFLLEAHEEYQNCSSTILNAVDNYGLLNLDIAWCYLNMEQLNELPQAERRLSECEICLNKIYGKDLERHRYAKVLLARLHLLQGVVAYHKGDLRRAKCIFKEVQEEFKHLYVPEDLIEELVALGYQETESRLALRMCDNNVPSAALHIDEKRQRRLKIREEELKEKDRNKKRKALGKTVNGKGYVNLGYLKTMKSMGFPHRLVVLALRQSNNDIGAAIDMIQNQSDVLLLSAEEAESNKRKKKSSIIKDDDIAKIVSIVGAEKVEAVKKVLEQHDGNVDTAIQSIMDKGLPSDHESEEDDKNSSSSDSDEAEAKKEFFEQKKQSDDAYLRMKDELGEDTEDNHLDLTLEEESHLLERYVGFLSMDS